MQFIIHSLKMVLTFIKSQRNKDQLVDSQGYVYSQTSRKTTWKCAQSSTYKCVVTSGITANDNITRVPFFNLHMNKSMHYLRDTLNISIQQLLVFVNHLILECIGVMNNILTAEKVKKNQSQTAYLASLAIHLFLTNLYFL